MTVVDTNDNTSSHIASLKSRGVTAVGRYYSSRASKQLTRPEARALSDAGIQIFTVFEDNGDPELSVSSGIHDAQIALQQATSVGQPEGSAIYFALEHLPNGYNASHVPGIGSYFSGLRQVLDGKYKLGVYSDGVVCDALLDDRLCDHAWLSASSAFPGSKYFDRGGRWSLAQRRIDLNWSGLSVDTNDAKDDFGAFNLNGAGPVVMTVDQIGRQPLRIGSSGPLVKDWQAFLMAQGLNIDASGADGRFGTGTRDATIAFQQQHGLDGDGAVGPHTIAIARQLGFGASSPVPAAAPAGRFDTVIATTSRMAAARPALAALPAAVPSAAVAAPLAAVPMRALRLGSQGPLVEAWQNFLVGKGFDPGGADGDFGDKTQTATMAFQSAQGLKADGVVGQQTFAKAMTLGFHLVEEPDTDDTGTNFPPRPNFPSLQSTSQRMALFGHFDFVPAPTADNRERIRILGSWVADNIIDVPIPQLRGTAMANPPITIRFHRLAAAQLRALWAAWESAGLLDLILTYDGSFVPRFKRGQANGGPEALSNHCFGSAFDINEAFNDFGSTPALVGRRGSVRKLVPIANEHGFYWGGHFSGRQDGMHFEIAFLQP
jgi:peptidoglycan hydrolase-like protein with peptidoglycan-binding domain